MEERLVKDKNWTIKNYYLRMKSWMFFKWEEHHAIISFKVELRSLNTPFWKRLKFKDYRSWVPAGNQIRIKRFLSLILWVEINLIMIIKWKIKIMKFKNWTGNIRMLSPIYTVNFQIALLVSDMEISWISTKSILRKIHKIIINILENIQIIVIEHTI